MADHSAAIAQIEGILNSGVTRTTIDGETVEVDHDKLRQRLKELKGEDSAQRPRRPRVSQMKMGGF